MPMRGGRAEHAAVPRSHSWGLDHLPPLATSTSEAQLHLLHQPGKRRLRHYDMPVSVHAHHGSVAAPDAQPTASNSKSAILQVELRLREVLMTTPAWPPSRKRVQAALDTLDEICRVPSKFSGILPLVASELASAIVSRREGGDAGPPARMHFELLEVLRDELSQQRDEVERCRVLMNHVEETRTEQERDEALELLRTAEGALADCRAREAAATGKLRAAKAEYASSGDEKAAMERKLAVAEEARRAKEDAAKEIQVALFVEQRKLVEQQALFREHRHKAKVAAAASLGELHMAQRMLLRAHHASLHAEGNAVQLDALPLDQQLARAMRWADGLSPVKAEAELPIPEAPAPSAAPASSLPLENAGTTRGMGRASLRRAVAVTTAARALDARFES